MSKEVYMEKFAVEINNKNGFVKQIDVFSTLEEADKFVKEYNEPLKEDEFLNIICIEYNENEDEIGFYSVL